MNVLPVEMHSVICEFACTDDGRTGRSLGLVSKYYREVVHPFRYQSIAVVGQSQVAELSYRLQKTPPTQRVRNIFISDAAPDNESGIPPQHGASQITRLLGLVSSAVETLTLHCDNPRTSTSLLAFLFGLHYPYLRELTVVGYYPFPHVPNAMPRLKFLHLNGNRNPHGLLQMGGLDVVCPELTHLRISGLSRATAFAAELVEAMTGDDDASQALFNAMLPPNVRHIVIQPDFPVHTSAKFAAARLSDDSMMEQFGGIVGNAAITRDMQFTLLKRSGDTTSTSKRQWLERLNGGLGCWDMQIRACCVEPQRWGP